MKKIIILMLLMLSTIPFVNLRAEIVTQEYDLTYTHGYWYDLYDGTFEANPNFSVTNRNKILKGSIILDDLTSFHHLIYFDKNNKMIGYMNTTATEIETPLFIDNITSFIPDIPSNAVYFALMGFYPYLNSTPIPEINNLTLGQVFNGTYDLEPTFNLLSSTSFLDLPIAELNNHTLREVFEGGNLIVNGDFDTNTPLLWGAYNIGTNYAILDGELYWQKPITSGEVYTNAHYNLNTVINNKYYIVSSQRHTVADGIYRLRIEPSSIN